MKFLFILFNYFSGNASGSAWILAPVVVACLATGPSARCASSPAGNPGLYQDFKSTCIEAFVKSNGADGELAGREICGCAVAESRHQGVTRPALRRETSRIRQDPAYQIQDKRLLAAFQYCTVVSMKKADRSLRERERKAGIRGS